jgi:hypothetical protein
LYTLFGFEELVSVSMRHYRHCSLGVSMMCPCQARPLSAINFKAHAPIHEANFGYSTIHVSHQFTYRWMFARDFLDLRVFAGKCPDCATVYFGLVTQRRLRSEYELWREAQRAKGK